ncbi:hypothetical protein AB0L65_22310 [Nonomuraea sp. NPDC052116]|uniref:hypothetical protein n=1 Tax=Nonomuraea sp. NPDC052116 TaxID=3155665 RepID=UPI003428BA29
MSDASDGPAEIALAYTVPARPDGRPDLPGRRPLSNAERARLRAVPGSLAAKHGWDLSEVPTDNGKAEHQE